MSEHFDAHPLPPTIAEPTHEDHPARRLIAEGLARLALSVGAQRCELFRTHQTTADLVGWWAAFGQPMAAPSGTDPIPLDWFPWSLGNVQVHGHLLVQNAESLPWRPDRSETVADVGMRSCLYLPHRPDRQLRGALCLYWSNPRQSWDRADQDTVSRQLAELSGQVD